ncbi:MAG: DUF1116 domain-containing protein [Candidatus Rokuibacteriota bacterium]
MSQPLRVINLGLEVFAEELHAAGVPVIHVDWRPPAGGDPRLGARLARLDDADGADRPVAANAEALRRLVEARPVLIDCVPAADALGLEPYTVLHAGPPLAREAMCPTLRGAVAGALRYERWAASPEDVARMVVAGDVRFEPCHDRGAVGPMTGLITRSMPVFVVENRPFGSRAGAAPRLDAT